MFLLQTHYDILGIPSNATDEQVKSAFRRLAKLYHPDKNPNGKEQFEKILIAYEVLIDSSKRRQYDLRLRGGGATTVTSKKQQAGSTQKNWNFSDEELKRRQYYQEHYRKEYEQYVKTKAAVSNKKSYNEYKYILYAAPIAVLLFMLVVKGFESPVKDKLNSENTEPLNKEIEMGYDPYTSYFQNPIYDTIANRTLVVKNICPFDLVLVVHGRQNNFVRSCVIKQGYFVELDRLPDGLASIKIAGGKKWNGTKEYEGLNVIGGFEEQNDFYFFDMSKSNGWTITIDESFLNASEKINYGDFFRRN